MKLPSRKKEKTKRSSRVPKTRKPKTVPRDEEKERKVLARAQRDEAKFILSKKVEETLGRMKMDPITEMAMYAKGDVVGLGLMSQDELDADEEYNAEGMKVRMSGRDRALDMIPPSLRAKMTAELVSYHFPRKKAEESAPQESDGDKVHLYIPDNGRTGASS